ncbi:uncharacterized protein [Rutidosis leptorrhynchoides]|uniref:uncharacterized protein n=1 Tax=Rutidosis leptorrhynchoides TaxID=125765 RepID=UPI003A9A2CF3
MYQPSSPEPYSAEMDTSKSKEGKPHISCQMRVSPMIKTNILVIRCTTTIVVGAIVSSTITIFTYENNDDGGIYSLAINDVSEINDGLQVNNLEHLRIELRDIHMATNNFSKDSIIKDRENYCLYKGELECFDKDYISFVKGKNKDELPKKQYIVTIKRIRSSYHDYNKEIRSLSHCNHQNIESLLGFCEQDYEVILVYEYFPANYLHFNMLSYTLTWEKRLQICIDVAHGLNYLHNEIKDHTKVIHGSISCDNILLDDNDRAKIGGFECSKLLPPNKDFDALHLGKTKPLVEDPHMDPEYVMTGMLKRESDVFSFGVVMLEVLCGNCANILVEYYEGKGLGELARRWYKEGTTKDKIFPSILEENNDNSYFLYKGPNKYALGIFIKVAYWCLAEKQSQRPTMKFVSKELEKALALQENKHKLIMSLEEIKIATQNFRHVIGEGGFGRVYKGEVAHEHDNGQYTIVAKKLDTSGGQGEKQYFNELEILYLYKHENIISLVGYSKETEEKVIVYEYAARGSLDEHLKSASLTWRNRLKICIDVATGLEFLHGGVGGRVVIHRDIKAANILLFDGWKAKLGDFGLSLICEIDKRTDVVIDHPCGTEVYVDPQYLKLGFLTLESDIYSFGVVLFEILCGRATYRIPKPKNKSLLCFIKHNFEKGKQYEMVFKAIKEEIVPKSLTTFLNIIYKCLDDDREKRPTSIEVLAELKKALEFQDEDTILDPVYLPKELFNTIGYK